MEQYLQEGLALAIVAIVVAVAIIRRRRKKAAGGCASCAPGSDGSGEHPLKFVRRRK